MKKKIFYVLMIACIGMTSIVNTSCSNQTDLVANEQQEKAGPEGVLISFGLSAEDYGTDTEVGTRGISNAQSGRVIATSTTSLGNDLEVLTEVVEDNAPKTRAVRGPVPSANYIILAYKDGKKMAEWKGRVPVEIKGTGSELNKGTSFVLSNDSPDPAMKHLQPGTYKFYVFNTNRIYITDGKIKTDITIKGSRDAYSFVGNVTIPNVKKHKLEFVLKPMYARVRTKIKAYTKGAFSGNFNGNSVYQQGTFEELYIDPATGDTTHTTARQEGRLKYGQFKDNPKEAHEGKNNEIPYYYIISPDYTGNFFLEGTKLSQVSFEFPAGTGASLYGKNVSGIKIPTTLNKEVILKGGKSYTLVYTMYKKADYVFKLDNYGNTTVGSILANKGKTPIGIVIDKTNKLAIAIKDLNGTAPWVTNNAFRATTLYPQTTEGLAQIVGKYEGDKETSNANFTRSNAGKPVVRYNDPNFTAFRNIFLLSKDDLIFMFMPGGGEWNTALKYLGIENPSNGFNASPAVENRWGGDFGYGLQEALFYQVGGKPLNGTYWGAQEWKDNKALTVTATSNGAYFGGMATNSQGLVRPFMKY